LKGDVTAEILAIPGFSEPVSSLTHYAAAAGALILGPGLVRAGSHSRLRRGALILFVVSLVLLFAISGTYHLLEPGGVPRAVLRRIDHAAIFLLIAGTFTPIQILAFRGRWRWGFLLLMWACALTGVLLQSLYFDVFSDGVWLAMYIGAGWLGLMSLLKLARDRGWRGVNLMFWGGVVYTAGALLESLGTPILIPQVVGPHEVWHLSVIVAAAIHWYYIRQLARGANWAGPLPAT
jgi:channel protein (hemolysin III family)